MVKMDMDIQTKNVNATKTTTTRSAYITITDIKTQETWIRLNGKKQTKTSPGIPAQKFKNTKNETININIKNMVMQHILDIGAVVNAQIKSGDLTPIKNED